VTLPGADKTRRALGAILDRLPQPLALLTTAGRVLHQNRALVQAAAREPGDGLMTCVRRVAHSVAAKQVRLERSPAATTDMSASHGQWHVVGCRLDWEWSGEDATILVSLLPLASDAVTCETLRSSHGLTLREVDVLRLLRRRRSNAEISRTLAISEHTARHHTESVLSKLGLHSRTQIDELFSG
jgi:DNA-binding CsgD family transcriptional regulator